MPPERAYRGHRLRKGRHSEQGLIYLVTTVTRGRRPIFSDWVTGHACAVAIHAFPRFAPVTSLAWVIMSDHLHWLFRLDDRTLDETMCRFKANLARQVNISRGETGMVWQAGYHDRGIRREQDLRAVARYVIANPVRAGLCERVGDYPFWNAIWLNESTDANCPNDAAW